MISRVVLADLSCKIGGYCVTNADGEKRKRSQRI